MYMTAKELDEIVSLVDFCNSRERDNNPSKVAVEVLLSDCNGDSLGKVDLQEGVYVYELPKP